MTTDPAFGEELTDGALQGEIELVGDLVVAAAESDGPLTQDQIDQVLGVCDLASAPAHDADLPVATVNQHHSHPRRLRAGATS